MDGGGGWGGITLELILCLTGADVGSVTDCFDSHTDNRHINHCGCWEPGDPAIGATQYTGAQLGATQYTGAQLGATQYTGTRLGATQFTGAQLGAIQGHSHRGTQRPWAQPMAGTQVWASQGPSYGITGAQLVAGKQGPNELQANRGPATGYTKPDTQGAQLGAIQRPSQVYTGCQPRTQLSGAQPGATLGSSYTESQPRSQGPLGLHRDPPKGTQGPTQWPGSQLLATQGPN
jgi:hypothetical protein